MAFIAVDAKADVEGSKKGRLTPAQHAILNAWSLPNKTGVLDFGNKCQATASSYTGASGRAQVVFQSGFLVICGRLVECEAGTTLDVDLPSSGSTSGVIVARFNLKGLGDEEFQVVAKPQRVVTKQDLNTNPTGTYEFALYTYKAEPALLTLENAMEYVPSVENKILDVMTGEASPLYKYDNSKGTIESRLSALGFRSGQFLLYDGFTAPNNNNIKRQGNYCIANLNVEVNAAPYYTEGVSEFTKKVGYVNNYYMPNIAKGSILSFSWRVSCIIGGKQRYTYAEGRLTSEGELSFTMSYANQGIAYNDTIKSIWMTNFGYEAKPL